jgi:DNA-binding transcriptional regulator YhcF (GntR family)
VIEFHLDPRSGVATYLQIVQQVKEALRLGTIEVGDQLPTVREVVAATAINPNTVAKAYRELEHEGVIELRHGAGAFVSANAQAKKLTDKLRAGQTIVAAAVERLRARGVTDEEIRRLFEAELTGLSRTGGQRG